MIFIVFHFIFFCTSISESQKSEAYLKELKKIDELEKMLNKSLDLLYEYVQKSEQSITINKGEDFVSQLEDLINRTAQIINNSKSSTSSTFMHIPLTMAKIEYKTIDSQSDFSYPGFFVPGDYPTITYKPVTKLGNHPIGIFFYNITNQSCEANELALTFHINSTVLPSQTIYLNQNSYNATYNINEIDDFDMLEVTVNAKLGASNYTCIPNFILYANNEEN